MDIYTENRVIGAIENKTMKKRRRNIIVICEDINFDWCEDEIKQFVKMWDSGFSVWDIARVFDRDPDEILMLGVHCGRQGLIDRRNGTVMGRRMAHV